MRGRFNEWSVGASVLVLLVLTAMAGCGADDTKAEVIQSSATISTLSIAVTVSNPSTTTSVPPTTTALLATTTTAPPTTTTARPTTTTSAIPDGIPWQDALDYVGKKVTILGPVVSTNFASSSNGSPTFLNVGLPYPEAGRFTVLIWGDDRGRFASAPEDMYDGQNIAVTGVVKKYNGAAEIIVTRASQIEVY
jgi:hypothetical protein